jgi:hypothetical protein
MEEKGGGRVYSNLGLDRVSDSTSLLSINVQLTAGVSQRSALSLPCLHSRMQLCCDSNHGQRFNRLHSKHKLEFSKFQARGLMTASGSDGDAAQVAHVCQPDIVI